MKKVLSIFLSVVMLLSVISGLSFTAQAATQVNSITIQGVVIPRPGATPSANWSKTGTFWKADAIKWYEVPSSGYDVELSNDSKFVEGKKYKASFVAWANTGYDFAAISSINATIDGYKATVSQYSGRDAKRVVIVSYIFTCEYKPITSVTLTCDSFAKGTTLTSDFFNAQGEGVNAACVSTFTRNGEAISIGEKVTFGDYGANVILSPAANYKFADNVSVTMGGKAFNVSLRIGMGIVVKSADDLWHIDCDHIYGAYQYDTTTHWKSCSNCGDNSNIDSHTFSETNVAGNTVYTCTSCGYEKTTKNKVDGFFYADVTGGVQITAYDGTQTNLTVPSTLGGKTVVSIGDYAFVKYANKTSFTSITLPSTVTSIGKGAFNGCTALASVNIPAGVKRIEAETFLGCGQVTNITIPYGVNFIGANAFQDCGIYSIILPCSIKTIKGSAFRSCDNLGSIEIPDSVTELGNAFLSCSSLKSVVVGRGVTTIAQGTFDGCTVLETITLPASLTKIDKYNFDAGCVVTVNYRGSETQFNAINITTNTDITSATKNYNFAEKSDLGQHKYIVAQTVAPTCLKEGFTLNMCEGCGDAFKSDIQSATGEHEFNSGVVTIPATCKEGGIKTYLCKLCGEAETDDIPEKSHSYKTYTTKATLSKNGKVESKCTACGYVKSTSKIYYPKEIKLSTTSYTYNGKVKTPSVTIKDSKGTVLKKDTDYTVTYASGRKDAGTYKVTVTMKGNYSGTKTASFKINPISASKCSFKLSTTTYTYNGKVKTPSVTVKDANGTKLTKNTHYTVKYASGRKYVGKYKVTVTMKGNYSGTKTLYLTVNPPKTSVSKLSAAKKSLKVTIKKKSTQVTGYQIQYSTSKSFKSKYTKSKTVKSYKTTSTTLKNLKAKKTYYVRVRTYKTVNGKKYYSGWSNYKYVKTK